MCAQALLERELVPSVHATDSLLFRTFLLFRFAKLLHIRLDSRSSTGLKEEYIMIT
jgi:hypothetical protein